MLFIYVYLSLSVGLYTHGTVFQSRRQVLLGARFLLSIVNSWRGEGRPRPYVHEYRGDKIMGLSRSKMSRRSSNSSSSSDDDDDLYVDLAEDANALSAPHPSSLPRKGLPLCLRRRAGVSLLLVIHGTLDYIGTYPPSVLHERARARARDSIRSLSNCYYRIG